MRLIREVTENHRCRVEVAHAQDIEGAVLVARCIGDFLGANHPSFLKVAQFAVPTVFATIFTIISVDGLELCANWRFFQRHANQ